MVDFLGGLRTYFELQEQYRFLYRDYAARGVDETLNPQDTEFAIGTPMDAYMAVGIDALRVIVGALTTAKLAPPTSILDFPSGSGRVTRHLKAFFPKAEIVASDLYERHLDFCRDTLGTDTVLSKPDPKDVDFGRTFDLIFCGSLLTHLPEPTFSALLKLLSASLSDKGIAVVTLHGRYSEYIQAHRPDGWAYMDDESCAGLAAEASSAGFGYRDYDAATRQGLFGKQPQYGISFSRPRFTMGLMETDPNIRILGYAERGWHDHQDVLIFGRPGVNEKS